MRWAEISRKKPEGAEDELAYFYNLYLKNEKTASVRENQTGFGYFSYSFHSDSGKFELHFRVRDSEGILSRDRQHLRRAGPPSTRNIRRRVGLSPHRIFLLQGSGTSPLRPRMASAHRQSGPPRRSSAPRGRSRPSPASRGCARPGPMRLSRRTEGRRQGRASTRSGVRGGRGLRAQGRAGKEPDRRGIAPRADDKNPSRPNVRLGSRPRGLLAFALKSCLKMVIIRRIHTRRNA